MRLSRWWFVVLTLVGSTLIDLAQLGAVSPAAFSTLHREAAPALPPLFYPALQGLHPEEVWRQFGAVSRIPRPTGQEAAISAYVAAEAARLGLDHHQDACGNVIVRVPAARGWEQSPVVALQCHLDMVCVKDPGATHDFAVDPIPVVRDGDWIRAAGTSLGADNGIGVAVALALMNSHDFIHGPLELIFTVDEEGQFTGVFGLDPALIKARLLLNLDGEEEGMFITGCCGGIETVLTLPLEEEDAPAGFTAGDLRVSGLTGGHSGLEIDKGRANALKLLAATLARLEAQTTSWRLATIQGGEFRNAIPAAAVARILLREDQVPAVRQMVDRLRDDFRRQFAGTDPGLDLVLQPQASLPARVARPPAARRLIRLLQELPHGVIAMSQTMPGVVETSTNLARLAWEPGRPACLETSQRSSFPAALQELAGRIARCGTAVGATAVHENGYPPWIPNPESGLTRTVRRLHLALFGKEPRLSAYHAGLECGVFAEYFPDIDMVAFGPTILDGHSTRERLSIRTVAPFYEFVRHLLTELARPTAVATRPRNAVEAAKVSAVGRRNVPGRGRRW